jgi:hypothetical protein
MRARIDRDDLGDLWITMDTGPGAGYMGPWWVSRNEGPGAATQPGRNCGHTGLSHCNSIHCGRWWCRFPSSMIGRLLMAGHSLRVWLGPDPRMQNDLQGYLWNARTHLHAMRLKRLTRHRRGLGDPLYSVVSAR